MKSVHLHTRHIRSPDSIDNSKLALESKLTNEGYHLTYWSSYVLMRVTVRFKDDAQAAIYKLTYM